MTDAAVVYKHLGADFDHHAVNHSIGEYICADRLTRMELRASGPC